MALFSTTVTKATGYKYGLLSGSQTMLFNGSKILSLETYDTTKSKLTYLIDASRDNENKTFVYSSDSVATITGYAEESFSNELIEINYYPNGNINLATVAIYVNVKDISLGIEYDSYTLLYIQSYEGETRMVVSDTVAELITASTDTTAPSLSSVEVGAVADNKIVLTYDESLDETSTPATGDFSLSGTSRTVSTVAVSGVTVTLTLSGVIFDFGVIALSYTAGTNKIQDEAGNAAVNLVDESVTNTVSTSVILKNDFDVFTGTNTANLGVTGVTPPATVSFLITPDNITDDRRLMNPVDALVTTIPGGIQIDDYDIKLWSGSAWRTIFNFSAAYNWVDQKHLLTVVYNFDGSAIGYFDGIEGETVTCGFDFGLLALGIAEKLTTFGNKYTGVVHEFLLFDKVLTHENIKDLYAYYFLSDVTYNSSIIDSAEPTEANLLALDDSMTDVITGLDQNNGLRCNFFITDDVANPYALYYGGGTAALEILVSSDLSSWAAYSGSTEITGTLEISILKLNDIYHLYYWAGGEIRHVQSYSPFSFDFSYYDVVVEAGAASEWDDKSIRYPGVVYKGGVFYVYYMGQNNVNSKWDIGLATSEYAQGPFTKHASNPVLERGGVGTPDEGNVYDPHPVIIGSRLYMAYTGQVVEHLCLAYSTDMVNFTKDSNNPIIPNDAVVGFNETINFNLSITGDGKMRCYCTTRDVAKTNYKIIESSVIL